MMSLGAIVGKRVLAELSSLKVPLCLIPLNLMPLWVWALARFAEPWDKKMMITEGGYTLNAFHFNEVCFPFFTSASRFFAEVVIALQGFLGSAALSEALS